MPDPEVISTDLPCTTCAYNLRGLPSTGICPECTTSVALSQRRAAAITGVDAARFAHALGLALLAAALLACANVCLLFGTFGQWGWTGSPSDVVAVVFVMLALIVNAAAAYPIATASSPRNEAHPSPTLRKALLILALLVAASALPMLLTLLLSPTGAISSIPQLLGVHLLIFTIALTLAAASSLAWVLVKLTILEGIAQHLNQPRRARRTTILSRVMYVAILIGAWAIPFGPLAIILLYSWIVLDVMLACRRASRGV